MSPLHHAFCGTHSLLMYCLYVRVCVSFLYACCICSIEIIITCKCICTLHNMHVLGEISLALSSCLLSCMMMKILGLYGAREQ